MTDPCGTPGYVAPEVVVGQPYGMEVDNWTVGVLAFILLCGVPPFYAHDSAVVDDKIKKADYTFTHRAWEQVSDDAKDLIKKLLVVDPDTRLTAEEALKHRWVNADKNEQAEHYLTYSLDGLKEFNQGRNRLKGAIKAIRYTVRESVNRANSNVAQDADAAAAAVAQSE